MPRFILVWLILLCLEAPGQTLFEQVFDAGGLEQGYTGLRDTSGRFWLTGFTTNGPLGKNDLIVVQLDSTGQWQWTRQYGGIDHEGGFGLALDPWGDVLVCGYTRSQGSGQDDVWLLKLNGQGDTLWQTVWGGTGTEAGFQVFADSAGCFVAGHTHSFGYGFYDLLLLATDTAGQVLWYKTYGSSQSDVFGDAVRTPDGGFLLGGYSPGFGQGGNDWYVVRTDSLGDTLWTRNFGTVNNDYLDAVATGPGGVIYLMGTEFLLPDSAMLTLRKLDAQGNLLWTRHLPAIPGARARDLLVNAQGNLWFTGYIPDSLESTQLLLAEADSSGQLVQVFRFGLSGDESGWDILPVPGGRFLLTGTTTGFGNTENDLYAVLTDTLGHVRCPATLAMDAQDSLLCLPALFRARNQSGSSAPYTWLLNGQPYVTGQDFVYVFDSAGEFLLDLVVCTDTLRARLSVLDSPQAAFTWTRAGDTIFFHAQSSAGIQTVEWNFGDNHTGTGANPLHVYASGQYYVTVQVTDTAGCTGTYGEWVSVFPLGTASPGTQGWQVYPVPARAGSSLRVAGLPAGSIACLLGLDGNEIECKPVENARFLLPAGLPAGMYWLQLTGKDKWEMMLLPVVR